jgi:hypothetical protein
MMSQNRTFYILLLFCIASFVWLVWLVNDYQQTQTQTVKMAKQQVEQDMHHIVRQIDKTFNQLSIMANNLADELSSGQLPRSQIRTRLESIIEKTPSLFGIGVLYLPYSNNPQIQRQSPYYISRQTTENMEPKEWIELFTVPCFSLDPATQRQTLKCIVFVDYLLNDIKKLINTLHLGASGYGFILSKQGNFVSHPIPEYVETHKTLFEVAALDNDKILTILGKRAINGKNGILDYTEKKTGRAAFLFHQSIPTIGWTLGAVAIQTEILAKTDTLQKVELSLWLIVFLVLLSTLLFRVAQGESENIWKVAALASALLLAEVILVWYWIQTIPCCHEKNIIVNKANLHKFLSSHTHKGNLGNRDEKSQTLPDKKEEFPTFPASLGGGLKDFIWKSPSSKKTPFLVPTGMMINDIDFLAKNQVLLKGYIWQTYHDNQHQGISRGFLLPQAHSVNILESYRHKENQTETIGWFFEAKIAQPYDLTNYPYDIREINLLIHHKYYLEQNVILVPDLAAYVKINPYEHPCIPDDFGLPGWKISTSYFNYGLDNQNVPNLYFTFFLKRNLLTILTYRNLLNSFIGNLLPVMVTGLMLFAILSLLGRLKKIVKALTFIGILFFGLLFAHLAFRETISTAFFIYIDYVYFVMYFAIIATMSSYLLYYNSKDFWFIQYQEGLIVKLLFLPLILLSILGITVWYFLI